MRLIRGDIAANLYAERLKRMSEDSINRRILHRSQQIESDKAIWRLPGFQERCIECVYRLAIQVMKSPYNMQRNPLYFKLITTYARWTDQRGQSHNHVAPFSQWLLWAINVYRVAGRTPCE